MSTDERDDRGYSLLAVLKLFRDSPVQCASPGTNGARSCGRKVHAQVHVLHWPGTDRFELWGCECFKKLAHQCGRPVSEKAEFPCLDEFGHILTAEERRRMARNAAEIIAIFRERAEEEKKAAHRRETERHAELVRKALLAEEHRRLRDIAAASRSIQVAEAAKLRDGRDRSRAEAIAAQQEREDLDEAADLVRRRERARELEVEEKIQDAKDKAWLEAYDKGPGLELKARSLQDRENARRWYIERGLPSPYAD